MKPAKCLALAALIIFNTFLFALPVPALALERVSMKLEYDGKIHDYENFKLTLKVDNEEVTELPMPPVIIDDYTYIPVKELFTRLGAVVDWNDYTKEVYIGYGDRMLVLQIGSNILNDNGTPITTPVAPRIVNSKTMVPIRFASEAFGFKVNWEDETKTVYVNTKGVNYPYESGPGADDQPYGHADYPGGGTENAADISAYRPAVIEPAVETTAGIKIEEKKYPETKITSIDFSGGAYTIRAQGGISRVERFLLGDNRFVVDIYNAEMALPDKILNISGNPYLSSIRAGQNQVSPQKITRVVFDIQEPVAFSLVMAPDRKSLVFSFEKNNITGFSLTSEGAVDVLRVNGGSSAPAVSVYPLENPERLVIDLPLSLISSPRNAAVSGRFVTRARSSQFNEETARIVLELKEPVSYMADTEGNSAVIRISAPTYKNISYNPATKTLTLPRPDSGFNPAGVLHKDLYSQYKYVLTFPEDMSARIGFGELVIKDDYISSISITTQNGATVVTINEKRILAYDVTADGGGIHIKAMTPKQKYGKIVVIDPGHGGSDPGTQGRGMAEKDITLDISNRLAAMIEADGLVKAYATRVEDVYPGYDDRTGLANAVGDIFVSVHINYYEKNELVNGTEVFYYPHANDANAGISGERMAEIFQNNLVFGLDTFDRKHKSERFIVLKDTVIPSVLCEIEFLSSPEGAARLASDEFRQKAASMLYKSILDVFAVYSPRR